MSAPRNHRHIVVPGAPRTEKYQRHKGGGGRGDLPPDPASFKVHADRLTAELKDAQSAAAVRREAAEAAGYDVKARGVVLEFASPPGFELELASLENVRAGIELLCVRPIDPAGGDEQPQTAVVFVPDDKVKHFLKRFEEYASKTTTKKQKPMHQPLVQAIADIRLATLKELWTDERALYPADDEGIWWEVWLRHDADEDDEAYARDGQDHEEESVLERFTEFSAHAGVRLGERRLAFVDRVVVLAFATPAQLATSIDVLGDIAEVRRAKDSPTFFEELDVPAQAEWVIDLANRLTTASVGAPTICVLDTGVNRSHPLLEASLAPEHVLTCDPTWGVDDRDRHGTEVAGLALLGDLTISLATAATVTVPYRLESVKILLRRGDDSTPPDLYGARTAQATSIVEIAAPGTLRCFVMAISSPDARDRGRPSSWSAAVDSLAAGRSFDATSQGLVYLNPADESRLFVVAAGNVEDFAVAHLDRSDVEVVHDPAQAWNAIAVGAHTERAVIGDDDYDSWQPIAAPGDLSPYSTTSVSVAKQWPVKPDVVIEGGNVVHDTNGRFQEGLPSLSVLTTYFRPSEKLLVASWATSAAAAQVARLAGHIRADYPDFWPETVRALIVHSARWTPRMTSHLGNGPTPAAARALLVQRFGLGVPDLSRATRSARDALTLVSQATIRPYEKGKLREMHLHELPWPRDVLAVLGDVPVTLRVTLSYFIEPNPGHRGWTKRHRYASHGLRFDVKLPTETAEQFHKRLNKLALDEEEQRPTTGTRDDNWFLKDHLRHRGSVHTDLWNGTAVALAERGCVAVYPVGGWWKEQPKRDRSGIGARYALIVSIESPEVDVDILTSVVQQVGVAVVV